MKRTTLFVMKSIVFSIIFLTLSGVILSVFYNFRDRSQASSSTDAPVAQEQQNDNSALMEKYWLQAAEADKLYEVTRKQQAQAAEQLRKQEELLTRWQKVIERWEKTQH